MMIIGVLSFTILIISIFLFYNANQKIKKGSKTSYADWCDKKGIKWAHKHIPREWLDDIYDDLAGKYNKSYHNT